MIGKRSILTEERLTQLKGESLIYEITCGTNHCPCGGTFDGCGRGFFSLFIQAIYGIDFAKRHGLQHYVNFGNCRYLYSDLGNTHDNNFWNNFFIQTKPDGSKLRVTNLFNEVYPLRIWDRFFLKRMFNNVVKNLKVTEEVAGAFEKVDRRFSELAILGVHIRGTDHSEEIAPVKFKAYLKEVDRRINGFDKLFLATDEQYVVDIFQEKYGSKLMVNDVIRSSGDLAVHYDQRIKDRYRLGLDALIECYSLSICSEAILTHSNLSYAALLFNPDLKYKLMERWRSKVKRLKTLFLYYLDKWEIRKW